MSSRGKKARRVPLGPGGEFDLIRRLLGPEVRQAPGVLLGPGDDCAVLDGGWVISADISVEDVHFRREWIDLEEAGYRSVAVALSDLAAMASDPVGVLLSMALPPVSAHEEAVELQEGAEEACRSAGCQVLGGDLAGSPGPIVMDVVVVGRTPHPVDRGGSKVGDEVWVTGVLGGSAGAVACWDRGDEPPVELREAFASPRPRIREALWLSRNAQLHGLIDLSDGLGGDAGHLAAAAEVCIRLREDRIPVHPILRDTLPSVQDGLRLALEGGEDFELCLTVPPETLDEWVDPFQDSFGIPLTKVGRVTRGRGVVLEGEGKEGRRLDQGGFSHFAGEAGR